MMALDVGVVRAVVEAGPNDRVFDAMLLSGPLVVSVLAVLGRSRLTLGLAVLYLAAFVGYVAYKSTSGEPA